MQKKIESETIEKEDWALGRLLDYVNMAIRDAVIDDDMPTFVSKAVKYYIESMWGEIKGNILKGTKKNIRRNVRAHCSLPCVCCHSSADFRMILFPFF